MRSPAKTAPEGHRTIEMREVGTTSERAARVPVLVVLSGPQVGERIRVSTRVEIGRDPRSSLRLRDPHVGLRHLVVEPTSRLETWKVIDLGAGSTSVRGQPLAPGGSALLDQQAEIRVGDTLLRVELHGEIEQEFDRIVVERLHKDELTGLLSRRKFEDELGAALELDEGSVVLVLLDIDGLKRVNDTHGHLAGAAVIKHVGKVLARTLGARGIAARLGGDELAILFTLSPDDALRITEDVMAAIRFTPCVYESYRHTITVAAGLSTRRAGVTEIVRAADEALLEAKRRGGDVLVVAP